jgi:hypothetical protein
MYWRCDWRSRVLALWAWSPEFKIQYNEKKIELLSNNHRARHLNIFSKEYTKVLNIEFWSEKSRNKQEI